LKKRKEPDDEAINLTGRNCDVEMREYKEIQICGCKFGGFNCEAFEAFIDASNPDKSKHTPLKFRTISHDNLSKEE